jgi:endonuclease-8
MMTMYSTPMKGGRDLMPEGDTLYTLAARLRPVLLARPLRIARLRGTTVAAADANTNAETSLDGRTVRDVETRGKHLLLHFDDDTTLHIHLGMTGRWDIRPLAEPGLGPGPSGASLVFETAFDRVVGTHLPVVERLTAAQLVRHAQLRALGPDLLSEDFDARAVAARFGRALYDPIGVALLDQTLACGIGNVYKSEALFLSSIDPWATVAALGPERVSTLLEQTRGLMRRNLEGDLRRTRRGLDADRHFVYGREGQPCKRCGAPVVMRRQGDLARSTYYCGPCQGVSVQDRTRTTPTGTRTRY